MPISNLINGLLQLDETANRASNKLNHLCPICKCIFKRGGDHLEGNQGTLKEEATAVTRLQCYKMSWSPVRVLLPHFAILNFLRPMFTRLCLCSCVIIFLQVHHVFPKVAIFLGFFLHRAKSAHLIIQNNSAEGPELWTQFCRRPNLKHRETTTWFCEACSACCRDYFGGRGHCVKMIVSEEFKKKHWAELILLYTLRVSGRNRRSAFRSLWQGSVAPMYICWLHLLKWKKCK